MGREERPRVVVIVGPTASGKSELALALAEAAGAEIVSADSQQVYRGMDIGTGKVPAAARARVPHHLIDIVDPDEDMSAQRFSELADAAIADAHGRGVPVVVAGGTMLYVRVLLYGLFDGPSGDAALRARLAAEAEANGPGYLWQRLAVVDAEAAARIHERDSRRLIRALEVYELTGTPLSEWQKRNDFRRLEMKYESVIAGIAPPREALYQRIDARVLSMMEAGLLDEVQGLRDAGFGAHLRSQAAIGYAELHGFLDGRWDLPRAVELIQRNSRRYARRQLSWYRGDERVSWAPDASDIDVQALQRYLRGAHGAAAHGQRSK